ncbi:unnamed protein product [Urochloa humidicola]
MDTTEAATNLAELLVAGESEGEGKSNKNLQEGAKQGEIVEELKRKLAWLTASLSKVSEVPADELDEQVKIWAGDAREISYDIQDYVDTFMSRGMGHEHAEPFSLKDLVDKATNLCNKAKTNHDIHNVVNVDMYKAADNILHSPTLEPDFDPRLVGIDGPKSELAKRILEHDCSSRQKADVISIVGPGGLGKTALALSLMQELKAEFDYYFLVSVSFNPDTKKILKGILAQLDKYILMDEAWEIKLFIDKIVRLIENRRFLCVIDDLWDKSAWDTIKLALQDGDHGSKIIITTRNKAVAEYVGGAVYELKPLSDDDSRKLLNKRIFGKEDGCPADLRKVTEEILEKCGGVPLAIITTASLLASKPLHYMEWKRLNNSIGSELEKNPHVDKLMTILSLGYYDLPSHLKTCLLSLSKYPEHQLIRKDVLVWSWIAEGFITPAAGSSLEETGEGYFNELISGSLIQPVTNNDPNILIGEREVYACQVHGMVLELIIKLSAEEGFVVVTPSLSDGEQVGASALYQKEIRWLSLHNRSNNTYAMEKGTKKLSKVRSLAVFGHGHLMPSLSSFRVLRVLQLEDCSGLSNDHLKDLDKLYLLKFLRLYGLCIAELPESIGNLESLEILDIRGAGSAIRLPMSFGKLEKLVKLLAKRVKLPDGLSLENMKSLRELVGISITLDSMTEISKLGEQISVLGIEIAYKLKGTVVADGLNKLILKYLHTTTGLQELVLRTPISYPLDFLSQVSPGLQRFMSCGIYTTAFPRWINPSLSHLTRLSIGLCDVSVRPEDLEKLAKLPCLRFLKICVLDSSNEEKLIIRNSASEFPCLTEFQVDSIFLQFEHGAMQKLQILGLAGLTKDHFGSNAFDYGLDNLLSLRHVVVRFNCPEGWRAIREAIDAHPNHPSLDIARD